jgi:hypothetical protein
MMLAEGQRRRAPRAEVNITRQALTVVAPTNQRIGQWQVKMARLSALAQHSPGPDTIIRCRDEALALRDEIASESAALDSRCSGLEPAVSASGRIADTSRALQSVARSLDRTLDLLGEGRPPR